MTFFPPKIITTMMNAKMSSNQTTSVNNGSKMRKTDDFIVDLRKRNLTRIDTNLIPNVMELRILDLSDNDIEKIQNLDSMNKLEKVCD